jgi:type I restriction enzyme S subunit
MTNATAYVREPIGRYVLPIETWSPSRFNGDREFDYIDLSGVDRDTKTLSGVTRIHVSNAPSRARQVVRSGDILVSTVRPNLNGVALVPPTVGEAIASTGFCVLRCDQQRLDKRFLFYWVRTNEFVADMTRKATGASYPAVTDRVVKDSEIPLPPLSEQQRIADILDKADAIRRKRQVAGAVIQSLPLAAFFDAFKQYLVADATVAKLCDAAEVVSGVAKGRKLKSADIRHVPYLRVANVQAGYLDLSEIKTIPAMESEIESLMLQHGDVVMTEGGDHDKLGRGALWEHDVPNCIHQNHVFRVRTIRKTLLPTFFVHYLQTEMAKAYFRRCAKKTTNLASINMTQLRALPVPLPPLKRQEQFDGELRTIARAAQRQSASEGEAGRLFDTLAHRAFRGEL